MRLTISRAALTLLLFGGCCTGLWAARPTVDIPLVLSFGSGETDRLTGDGLTPAGYAEDYANGLENVLAIIQGSGNLRFGTQSVTNVPAQRRMCLDFGDQFANLGEVVPFADANPQQCVNVLQPMHAYPTGDVSIADLRYGQVVEKLTRFEWDDVGYRYRLGYGTDMNMDGVMDSPPVRVTCIAPANASQPCTTWVLAPSLNGAAALFRFKLSSKKGAQQVGPPEFVAGVVMPFNQTFGRK